MTTTTFLAGALNVYLGEIFGSNENKHPLLFMNLSQKTKYNLRKLGESLKKEQKTVIDQLIEIRKNYIETVVEDDKKVEKVIVGKEDEFMKVTKELEVVEIQIEHPDFQEKDFIDKTTGEIVGSELYYNIIDKLIYEKE